MALPEYIEPIYEQAIPKEQPSPRQPERKAPQPQQRPKVLTKKEKKTLIMMAVTAVLFVMLSLISQVTLTNQSRKLQDLQNSSTVIANENTNLEQQIQELSQYDRVMAIAEELGLTMNEENVRNVAR